MALARDGLTLFACGAIAIARALTGHFAAEVLTDFAGVAVRIHATVTCEEAGAVDAGLTCTTVVVRGALRCIGDTVAVVTTEVGWAIKVIETHRSGDTLAILTCKAGRAIHTNVRATLSDKFAAEVVTNLVGRALVIRATITNKETRAVEANLCWTTIHIVTTPCRWHTLAIATDFAWTAIVVCAAIRIKDTGAIDADFARLTVKVTTAIRRARHATAVYTELVGWAIDVIATTWDRHADAFLTDLLIATLVIGATPGKFTLAVDALATKATIAVGVTLRHEDTLATQTRKVHRAIFRARALANINAGAIVTNTALAAIIIATTLLEDTSAIFTHHNARTGSGQLGAILVCATHGVVDALTVLTREATIGAVCVIGTLAYADTEPIITGLTGTTPLSERCATFAILALAVVANIKVVWTVATFGVRGALHVDWHAGTTKTLRAHWTICIRCTQTRLDARAILTNLARLTIRIVRTAVATLIVDANLIVWTILILYALRRIIFLPTEVIFTHKAFGARGIIGTLGRCRAILPDTLRARSTIAVRLTAIAERCAPTTAQDHQGHGQH